MTSRQPASVRVVLLALAIGACAPACDDDRALFEASLVESEAFACAGKVFPFEPSLFALVRTPNGVLVRMQDESQERIRADAFYITLTEGTDPLLGPCPTLDDIRAGTAVPVGPDQCAQAYFRLNEHCARDYLNPHIVGSLQLSSLGTARGERVEGTVSGQLVNHKAGMVGGEPVVSIEPMGTVNGTFSFEVDVGQPYQTFSTPSGPVANP